MSLEINQPFRKKLKSILWLWLLAGAAPVVWSGTFTLPLTHTNGWQFLKYRHIPPDTFHCTPAGLIIGVTNSAAPAVFPLTNELQVTELRVRGSISGSLKVPPAKQGQKGFDDYILRVGLVEPGTRTLSWWEKLTAADWVKKLFALAPPGTGIGKIHFFNVGTDGAQIGHHQKYSRDGLLEQTVVAVSDAGGSFTFTTHFDRPLGVIAVWISCDGDDTHSSFANTLNQVAFTTMTNASHF